MIVDFARQPLLSDVIADSNVELSQLLVNVVIEEEAARGEAKAALVSEVASVGRSEKLSLSFQTEGTALGAIKAPCCLVWCLMRVPSTSRISQATKRATLILPTMRLQCDFQRSPSVAYKVLIFILHWT